MTHLKFISGSIKPPDKDIKDFRIKIYKMFRMRRRGLIGGMIVGGATGAVVGHYTAKKQFESMAAAQAQQTQIDQAQAQAAQAAEAALIANQEKKDITQELEKLASLRQQGILSEEEFQQMKARILSNI
jgi:membrane protease subunit (stomatin/prohibitin family)